MTIKSIKTIILLFSLSILAFGCKKENYATAEKFGLLNISNKTTYLLENLSLSYNGLVYKGASGFSKINIPAGPGKLSLADSTGTILDTLLNIEANKTANLILFQPTANMKPLFIENNQSDEAQPAANYLKIKAVNFAINAFSKPVDIVFNFKKPGGGIKPVPADTLESVNFGKFGQFTTINKLMATNVSGSLFLLDSQTKEKLTGNIIFNCPKRIYTIYIVEDSNGVPVANTTYSVSIKTLFED